VDQRYVIPAVNLLQAPQTRQGKLRNADA